MWPRRIFQSGEWKRGRSPPEPFYWNLIISAFIIIIIYYTVQTNVFLFSNQHFIQSRHPYLCERALKSHRVGRLRLG